MTEAADVERVVRASGPESVTLRWVCPKLKEVERWGRVVRQPCRHEFTATHPRREHERRACRARCPSCGHQLTQTADGCAMESER